MSDRIYGIQQGQPKDVFNYAKTVLSLNKAPQVTGVQYLGVVKSQSRTLPADTYTLVVSDKAASYDAPLADGRTLRYSKVTLYAVGMGSSGAFDINLALAALKAEGYDRAEVVEVHTTAASLLASTGEADYGQYATLNQAIEVAIYAGAPRYLGEEESILDAPTDGNNYVRAGGEWVAQDLSAYDTIASVDSKISAAVGSTFTSRQILTNADVSVFGGGPAAIADPNGTSGWYYKNEAGAKITWYYYGGGEDSDTLGAIDAADGGFYVVLDARNATSWPYFAVYTERQNDGGDASWFRSRLTYGKGGDFGQKLNSGLQILHTANFDPAKLAIVQGKYPTATAVEMSVEAFSSAGPQGPNEKLWLIALSTSSGLPAGQEEFVVRETGMSFGGKVRTIQYVANPTQPAPYTDYFKGSYALVADYPEGGILGQWIINSTDDTMLVWDVEGGEWKATGSTAAPATATVNDYPFQYVYSSLDGSGYGFENAYPAAQWQNTPDGKLQATGGSSDILGRRVKFATLKNPGDEVTVQASDNSGAYNRYTIIGLTAGTDADSLSWKVAGQPSSGTSWMMTDPADQAKVEMYTAYMEPYWGGTTYGYNLTSARNSTGYGYTGNAGELPVTFRVNDDYHIEMYIDGTYFVRTLNVPSSGVDLYYTIYGNTGRIFEQPTGNGANFIGGTAPNATGARYFMSSVATPVTATELASGGGYFLYSDTVQGDASDCELTASEAGSARFSRVFVDYTGMTVAQRADETYPIVLEDERALDRVEYLARGYFHSLDLDVPTIQAKMAEFADALEAATAGSVEVCLAILQGMLGTTTEPVLCGELIDLLAKHLQKFPR